MNDRWKSALTDLLIQLLAALSRKNGKREIWQSALAPDIPASITNPTNETGFFINRFFHAPQKLSILISYAVGTTLSTELSLHIILS